MAVSRTLILAATLLALGGLMAGCSSSAARAQKDLEKQEMAKCPPRRIAEIIESRAMAEQLKAGVTPTRELKRMGRATRTLTLRMSGQSDLMVAFYPIGLGSCSWVSGAPNFMPVVAEPDASNGQVLGYGFEVLKTLQHQGWQLGIVRGGRLFGLFGKAEFTPVPWPWQSWNYSYLPRE